MNTNSHVTPIAAYVGSLLECVGQLTLILDHMARHESPDTDAPIHQTLALLLEDVLDAEASVSTRDLGTAREVVAATSRAIEDGLFLDPGPDALAPPNPGQGSPNGHDTV